MADKVLLIEDDTVLGQVLLQKLQTKGYEVKWIVDGAEGLEEIRKWSPRLVLLDIILPTMNGYEILEAKAKDPAIAQIPVIVISNSGQPVEISRTVSLGVKDYMIKADFDPEEVLTKVENNLSGSPAVASALAGKTILVVEDDNFLSYIITTKLQHHGATVLTARSAEEAYVELGKQVPNLVLLDLILGPVNGFEVLEKIRKDTKTTTVPVIVLSNLGQQDDIERCNKLGANKYFVKANITPDAIIQEINEVLLRETK